MSRLKRLYHNLWNLRAMMRYCVMPRDMKALLLRNRELHGTGRNRRCFVLGNGPSLNLYDLSVLKDETVFVVNDFVRYRQCDAVKADYYIMADPKFFDMDAADAGDADFIGRVLAFSERNRQVKFYFPLSARNAAEKYGWTGRLDIGYFLPSLYFKHNFNGNIDFTRTIPGMQCVVQYGILMAVYMGFKQIYLLGTDQTNIFGSIKAYMDSSVISEYAFPMDEAATNWKHAKMISYSLCDMLRGYARIFELYSELGEYCGRRGIELVNCAPETLVQGVRKGDFAALFR